MEALPRVLVADPPWQARDKLPGKGRGSAKHYQTMSTTEICDYPIPKMGPNAWLFLWRVAWAQREALLVCTDWGFTVVAEMVWVKTRSPADQAPRLQIGMGHYVRNAHETCLIAVRKGAAATRLRADIPSVFFAPRGVHSAKPETFYRLVEELAPGPRCELFARRRRPGWQCFGLELEPEAAE